MKYYIKDAGKEYVNRYTLFRIQPIQINDGTTHQSVQYYGCFGWSPSSTVTIEDLSKFQEVSEEAGNKIKNHIQQ